jgi:hypothetical protein
MGNDSRGFHFLENSCLNQPALPSASVLIIILSLLTLVGFAALIHAVQHADIGYENLSGFHEGVEPAPPKIVSRAKPAKKATAVPETATGVAPEALVGRAKRAVKVVKKAESAQPFQFDSGSTPPGGTANGLGQLIGPDGKTATPH